MRQHVGGNARRLYCTVNKSCITFVLSIIDVWWQDGRLGHFYSLFGIGVRSINQSEITTDGTSPGNSFCCLLQYRFFLMHHTVSIDGLWYINCTRQSGYQLTESWISTYRTMDITLQTARGSSTDAEFLENSCGPVGLSFTSEKPTMHLERPWGVSYNTENDEKALSDRRRPRAEDRTVGSRKFLFFLFSPFPF